jgi:hypothetical protein
MPVHDVVQLVHVPFNGYVPEPQLHSPFVVELHGVHLAQNVNAFVHVPVATLVILLPLNPALSNQPSNLYPARITFVGKLNVGVSTLHADL